MAPDKDPQLRRAQDAHRVMTIEPGGTSGKTDVGFVGFAPKSHPRGQYLIFAKSLKRFEGARVVGIKFDLVQQPKLTPAKSFAHEISDAPAPSSSTPGKSSQNKTVDHARARAVQKTARIKTESRVVPFPLNKVKSKPAAEKPVKAVSSSHARAPAISRAAGKTISSTNAFVREVRAAMAELHRGKAVAAYQRLERALGRFENTV